MKIPAYIAVLVFVAFICTSSAIRGQSLSGVSPPGQVTVRDNPNDEGQAILVLWERSPDDGAGRNSVTGYRIYRGGDPSRPDDFEMVGFVAAGMDFYLDQNTLISPLQDRVTYYYYVESVADGDGLSASSSIAGPVVSSGQWFNTDRINVLIASLIISGLLLWFIFHARMGKELFIRRIAGLSAVDEAIGRATEMGKPVLYVSGLSTVDDVATIAAMNILGRVAKRCAQYDTRLIVPCCDPIVMTVEQEIVKTAYAEAGRSDAYNEGDIFFVTREQFAYVAAVDGIMVRERPATNFYMGMFYAESLVLAETGAATGAIQIAGTDAVTQLPFFITACDYTLIGEELYAASAYLSREPLLLGSLKGQDWSKFIIMVLIFAGVVLASLGVSGFVRIFTVA
jgi:hypothetical protein